MFLLGNTICCLSLLSPSANSVSGNMSSFMNTHITYLCVYGNIFGVSMTNSDITNRYIHKTVQDFYCKSNEVLSDFKHVTCVVKTQLLSSYCLDANGSQSWLFTLNLLTFFVVSWRITIRNVYLLPFKTHFSIFRHD